MNPDQKDKATVVTVIVQGDFGVAEIAVPRDRQGEFEPQLVKKGQSRLSGLDEKIIALYARGMSVRDLID
jgi:putative transposase